MDGEDGGIRREVLTRPIGGLDIAAGKHGRGQIRPPRVLQRQCDSWPRLARGAATHGVHDNHHRAFALHGLIDLFGCSEFLDAKARQLGAHRRDERFGIRHTSIVADPGRPQPWRRRLLDGERQSGLERLEKRLDVRRIEVAGVRFFEQELHGCRRGSAPRDTDGATSARR